MSKKTAPKRPKTRRTRLLALEPRMLFDGALGVDIAAQANAAAHADSHAEADAHSAEAGVRGAVPQETKEQAAAPAQADAVLKPGAERIDASAPAAQRNEIVFIDTGVEGYKDLLAGVNPNARVVLLDAGRDGVTQIAQFLSHESNVDAIHIVSHGSAGMLQLGSASLDVFSMAKTYGEQLAEIGQHLSKDADILVYGCDFGKGGIGNAAATELSWLTKADVASSTDLTGSAELGGNWDLERQVGHIETSIVFNEGAQRTFHNVMETLDWDKQTWVAGTTAGSYSIAGGTVSVTLTLRNADGSLAAGNPFTAGYPADGRALMDGNLGQNDLQMDVKAAGFANSGQYVDITIAFSQPGGVSNVSFSLFDIDTGVAGGGSTGFVDKVTVSGTNSDGTLVPASVTRDSRVAAGAQTWSTTTSAGGTVITGTNPTANTGAGAEKGTAIVAFDQSGITQISLKYQNANVAYQSQIGLHDISFDAAPAAPQVDLNMSDARPFAGESFGAASYANASTGTIAWNGNWVETDASGAAQSATAGNVLITGGEISITKASSAIQRAVNLSSQSTDSLNRLSFDYRSTSGVDAGTDKLDVQVSANGGTTWTTIDAIDPGASASGTKSYDITAYSNANTVVRFKPTAGSFNQGSESFLLDNVKITAQPTSFSASYTEGGAAVNIAGATAAINDNSTNMSGATISVGSFVTGDALTWANQAGITTSYNSATGVLTATGAASRATYESLLRSVQYSSSSDDPTVNNTNISRTISVVITDDSANASNTARSTITVQAVNDAPVLTAGATLAYTEQAAAAVIDNTVTLADTDDTQMASATVTIGNFVAGDTLTWTNAGAVTGVYNAATGVLTLSGTDTLADYQAVMRSVKFSSSSDDPTANNTKTTRTVTWAATDANSDAVGAQTSAGVSSTINLTAVNDAPVMTAGATLAYTEQGAAAVIDNTVTLTDADDTQMSGATVSIGSFVAGDTLIWTNAGTVTGAYNAATGVLTLSGTDTLANYQAVMRSVKFSSSSDDPTAGNTSTTRTVTWAATDANSDAVGAKTSTGVASTINVTAVNDASTLATGSTLNYTENGAAAAINAALTVTDLDNATLPSATVSISGNFASGQDVLSFTNVPATMGNIAGAYNAATGVMTLTSAGSTATLAQWQAALRAVQYSNSSDNPSTSARTVSYTVNDGAANSNTVTSTVNVAAVNDAPVLATGSTLNYTENGAATAINAALTVADLDNATLTSGSVAITGGFASGEDALSFTNVPATMGNIAGAYNAATGVMTLTSAGGTATLAQWQAAFRAVQYTNSSDNPSTSARTVSFTVNDGAANSNTVASTVNLTAVNDASTLATGSTLNYTENGAAAAINVALTVADLDNATLPSATVSITGNFASGQDVLSFTNVPATMGNIAGAYNAATGVMTLTSAGGTATLAQWQVALRAVQYSNSSDNPATSARMVSFTVNDGSANSNTVTSTVNVAAVNDAPVLATGSTLNYTENGAAAAINAAVTVADLDNATLTSGTVSITGAFASGQDVLSFTNVPATMGNIAGAYNVATGVMTLTSAGGTATLAQWQAAFRAVQYSNSSDNPSTAARTVSFTVNDGSANSNTVASTVNVTAVNDAAVLGSATVALAESNAALTTGGTLTITDVDSAQTFVAQTNVAGTNGTFSIAANGAWTYTANSAFNNLNVGQSVSDTFTVASADGTTSTVQVTINGTNDAAVLSSATVALAETNAALTTGGTLTITDVDSAQTFVPQTNLAGTNGTFSIAANGAWTYTANSAFDNLNVGQSVSDTFTVASADGTTTTVQVTINGTNDAAVLSSATVALSETNAPLTTGGTLTISDVDSAQTFVAQTNVAGTNGTFSIAANGAWTYTANSAFNNLNVGQSVSDMFTVASADGTTSTVQVTINGTNDAAVLSSATVALSETNAALSTGGTLTISDVDSAQTFVAQTNVAGANGTFSIAANGAWTYTANSAFNNLNVGQSVSDTFTVASADGTTSTVQVTINGTNDAAVLSSATVALSETNAALSTGGTLTISDVDSAQTFVAQTNVAGANGTFSIAANGAWTYTANSSFDSLNVGQSVSDTFTVASADGTTSTVQVTINGTNDAAVLSSATVALSETNAALTTGGTLTVADVDSAQTFVAQTNVAGANGTFSIAANGAWTYTANSAFDSLNVGQSVSDTFTVASADGTTSTVQVTINGTNDAAVLSSATVALAESNAALGTGGTLTISDVDSAQTFVAQTNVAGTNGTFSIAANGVWSYTANSAFDSLNVGQSVSDTFTVASADGTTSTVQVTINGTNDAAVLSSATVALAETNAALATGGTLTISDVDSAQTFVAQTNVAGTNGTFSIAANGVWSYTANSAFDSLNVGQSVSDTFTVASADGTTSTVQVTINGTNDAAVLSSATVALAETNAVLATGGTLTVSDVDSAQSFVAQTNVAGTNGTFSIAANGAWTYTANSAFDNLNIGQSVSDTFTVAAADGTTTTVQVTINGTNDAAVLSSATVALAETNAPLSTGGALTASDVDSAQTFVPQTNVAGANGTFSIAANGAWTYTANSAFDNLNVGQSVSDTFTVASADGTTSTVQVTINGTNDAAVLSSATVALAETNAPLSTGGALTASDVDSAQTFVPQANVAGTNGSFSIAANGAWTYVANSAFDYLNAGQSVSDTFTVASADGTTSTVQVTINGTNDAAVLSSASVSLAETNAPLTASGSLSISDVDSPQTFVPQTNVAGANGVFSIAANGAWTYTADSAFDNLNVGQSVSDTFTVAAADGTTTTVQVTINGTNDAAVLSSTAVTLSETNAPLTIGGTLTVIDPDSPQTFVPQTNVAGANGTFSLAANGAWTYSANGAFDNLNVGQSVSDSFTVATADGTSSTVQVTINGTNDAAVLSSATVALSETNAPLTTGGALTISDVDSAQTFVAQTNVAGTNGTFSIAANGAWTYTANSAFDNLNVGQSVSDTFTVASADGTTSTVQVTINGTNDAAVVSSATVALAETDAPLTTGGTLTVSDVDNAQAFAPQTNVAGVNGTFSIAANGAWTYTANSAFDSLNVGQSMSDTFTVSAVDGTTSTVQVTINGTDDAAVLSSAAVSLNEANAPLTTGGALTITDPDSPQSFVAQTNVAGANGTFSIAANGAWTYTANSAFDNLNVGQSVSDTFTVASADGTTTTVQVTINGTNDAAVLSSATVALAETNAPLTTGGTLTVSDVDSAQTFVAQTSVAGANGTFSIAANGAWTYTANSAFDNLNVGQSVSDTFTVASADGTTTTVQVTINGTNDAAVVSSAAVVLAETNAPATTGGTLTVSDVDNPLTFIPQSNVAGANGSFSIAADGTWTYVANSAFDNLNVGQSVSDTFTVASADGTTSTVQVTINGTNDAAVLSSATVSLTETDAPLTASGTLSVTDVDSAQTYVAQTNVAGANGTFSIAANGAWTYTANSAFDNLNVGQSVSDIFTVASADGTTTTVQVTINGNNDAAVLSATSVTLTEINAPLVTGGTLSVTDVDNPQTFVPQTNVAGANGTFSLAVNGAWSYTANDAFDYLNDGDSLTDTFTVASADGTTSTVQITINGSNDPASVSTASVTIAETNSPLTTGGTLMATDVDNSNAFIAQSNVAGTNGTFSIAANGAWTYTANSALNELNVGQSVSDTFAVQAADGTPTSVQVIISGTNDAAVLSSATVALSETDAPLTTGGTLTVSDVDSAQTFVPQTIVAGTNGTFSIAANGAWTYTANSAFDNLNVGQSVSDTFTVSAADGTTTTVQVSINGTNDAAVLSSTTVALSEVNAPLTTGGTLTISDVDSAQTFVPQANVAGLNGTFSIAANGAWTYAANSAFDNLNVGQSVADTFTVASADGTTSTVQVTINGTNDAAVLSSAAVTLGETNAPLTTGGTLTVGDVDNAQAFAPQTNVVGANGTFSIAANGAWTYTASSAFDSLNVGQSVSDTFTVSAVDGTTSTVQVTINGTNDAAVLSSASVSLTENGTALSTSGSLTVSDVDSAPAFVSQTNVVGTNGTFSLAANGAWTYTANSTFDYLNVGQSVSDTFTVVSADGTTSTVQVTINGANNAAVISSAAVALNETNAPLSTGGTLTITDVDSPQTFVAQTNVAGANGAFSIAANGAWTYTANGALDNLNVGQSVSDTFTVASADGTTSTVQVTINGTNDAAVLSSATVALSETNAPLTTGGTLTVSDIDSPQTFVAQTNVIGTNGTFSIAANGAWTYTANSAFDGLNVGQSVSDTFTVASADGTTSTVQVTINGTNDAAVLSSAAVTLGETNAPLSTGGTLAIADVDSAQTFVPQTNVAGTNGMFSIAANGAWTYTASSAFDSLNVGQSVSDTFTVAAADGTTSTVQVTIQGTNDAAVVSSAAVTLTETNAPLTTGGTLTVSDVDNPASYVAQTNIAGANGTFSIAANGAWTYTANSAFDSLNVGQSVSDTFTVAAADGTTTTVQVTINGTNDAAVLSSATVTLAETDAPLTTGGTLTISDVDSAQTFVPQTNVAGVNGAFSIAANGAWTYTANSAFDSLNVGQSVADTFTVSSADGTTTTVQLTINGTNDAAVLTSATVALSETNAPLTTSGTLTVTDVDSAQAFVPQTNATGANGTFSIAANGAWTYSANSAFDSLNVGQSVSDTFTVASADGTTSTVQVTINGTNDAAVLSSATVALAETNAPLSTGGTLTLSDVDSAQTFVPQTNVAGANGTFSIAANGAWTYTANSGFDSLNVGQSVSDAFMVASADGTTSSVKVTINGTNDAAVLSSATVALAETNAPLTTGGTLTVTDVDSAQTFVPQTNVAGANGTFSIAANGAWTYTASSAFDNLNVGQSVSDAFTVASADGTTSTVQVTINGSNDAAIVSSATVALAETNAPLTTGGTLTVIDPDSPQTFVPQTNVAGANGTFSIAANGAWTYTANSAFDNLNVGQSVSDTFTVASADGTTTSVQVTINGTNDAAVLSSATVALAETNAPLTTGGTLTVTDVDSAQAFVPQTNVAGTNGTFSIAANGAWSYTANSAFDNLNVGQSVSDTFTVAAADGTTSTVQVTINGSNDAAIVSSATVSLAETNAPLTTGGTLTVSDVDDAQTFVPQTNVAGAYGSFSIAANGAWTYTANSALDNLSVGQSVSDTFTVASADGTNGTVQVTINGTNDAAVLSSATVALSETNAPLSTGGTLTVSDVDSAQTFVPQTNVAGANGTFSIAANGAWTYTANSAFDNLNVGQSVSDTFTVASADGTTSTVQVTINGTNDAAVLSSATVALSETNAPLSTGGTLTVSDVDSAQTFMLQTNVAGTNGTFSIAANGAWTYTANSAFDNLNVGQSVSDTFTVASADGTTSSVQVTINGTNDTAVVSSATVVLAETNAPLTTGGTLTVSDVDNPASYVAQTNIAGANGTFSIAANGAWTYTANSAFDSLNVGQSVSDTFTVASADGTTSTVQVTINGTNDAAIVSSATAVLAETNAPLTTGGTLTVFDVDDPQTFVPQTNVAGAYGSFSIAANGAWTYTANSAFDSLNVGQSVSDTFTVASADGTTSTVQVTINGTNDAAVLSSATVALSETNAPLTTGGTLTVSDVDSAQTFVAQTNVAGANGTFSIAANGAWTYTANSAFDNLNVGQSVSDTFTVAAADGTTSTVQVTITGTNDAAVLSSATVDLDATNAPLTTGGTLTVVDVDSPQAFVPQTNVAGANGVFSIAANGTWTYTASSAFGNLSAGQSVSDTFTLASADGTITTVQVSITGADRTPVLSWQTTPLTGSSGATASATAPVVALAFVPLPEMSAAIARSSAATPLGLPVDGAVPVSDLAGQPTVAAVNWPDSSRVADGAERLAPADGFPVVRLLPAQAGIIRVSDLDDLGKFLGGGESLFVYRGIPDMQLLGDGSASLLVPRDAFAHTDQQAIVTLEARLANGAPLPGWLKFESLRGEFVVGNPPEELQGITEVEVIARDADGREAHAFFALKVGTLRAAAGERDGEAGAALGLGVDKQEAEKARLEVPRPHRQGAASFSEQVSAAKAKDPLLERIARARQER